jgi:hypothetical protein
VYLLPVASSRSWSQVEEHPSRGRNYAFTSDQVYFGGSDHQRNEDQGTIAVWEGSRMRILLDEPCPATRDGHLSIVNPVILWSTQPGRLE